MPDQLELDPETRRQRLRDGHDHGPGRVSVDLAGDRIIEELRQMQPDFARANDVRDPRVGRLLRLDARHRRQQSDHREHHSAWHRLD